jgi:hypothetical protein
MYERLGLFPDALLSYLKIVNDVFPPRRPRRQRRDPRRSARPRWWPEAARDPFVIRYRYVIVLGFGSALASELCFPSWDNLRDWMVSPRSYDSDDVRLEDRPWRVVELSDMQRLIAKELDALFPSLADRGASGEGKTLLNKIGKCQKAATDKEIEARVLDVEKYLLDCAAREACSLMRSFRVISWMRIRGRVARRRPASLTTTAIAQASMFIQYRLDRLASLRPVSCAGRVAWPRKVPRIKADLAAAQYDPRTSSNWLEHYNAACLYALGLMDDKREIEEHKEYAYEAVAALERALECGEDVDFVKAKRYWLQAGDPDLAGLRRYECFRAFEARVYSRPLPAAPDLAKYELYLHLRAVLENGSRYIETEWRRRAAYQRNRLTGLEFEEWWRQEEHAWEVAVRFGRFYRQWQTRKSAVENLRNWVESFGGEAWPVPYPDIVRAESVSDTTNYERVARVLTRTEDIFNFLGWECGTLWEEADEGGSAGNADDGKQTVLYVTRAWASYARNYSRSLTVEQLMREEVKAACIARAATWAALRHWANSPGKENERSFRECVSRLAPPPEGTS